MEDQRRDIGKGVWFLALIFYSLIFSVQCQSVPSMTLEVSPNMTVQQEGTMVSLLCQVSGFNASIHFLSWVKADPTGIIVASSKELPVSDQRYRVSFTEGVISTFNLTISEVKTTDIETYVCNLIHQIDNNSSVGVLDKKLVLSVYPRDAFPSCSPNGPVTFTVGSPISCSTFGIVIGVVVLIIIIAIHTLCCRCDPRRWIHPKDYLIDCGSSRETSQAREDTSRSPPDVPMSREGNDVPHVYCSVLEENSVSNSQPGLPSNPPVEQEKATSSKQADPYMELNIADKKPSVYSELKL